jgi:hypothetical protein
VKIRPTNHDRCIQIVLDYIKSYPSIFRLIREPSIGIEQGPDLLLLNSAQDCIECVEVELDTKSSIKAKRIAKRAESLNSQYGKPVRVWMISSSDKWVTSDGRMGVRDYIDKKKIEDKTIEVFRIIPVDLGTHSVMRGFPFTFQVPDQIRNDVSCSGSCTTAIARQPSFL